MEAWKTIPEFPLYSVSNEGRVRNDQRDRLLAIRRTAAGVCFVGLSKDGLQQQRGLALLVASAHLPKPIQENFIHPIHLDGDKSNNFVQNLLWRPFWFAYSYASQFDSENGKQSRPVMDMKTRKVYETVWHAATTFGLLSSDIITSIYERTAVWPTFQEFRFVEK